MQNMLPALFVSTKLCVLFGPVFIMIIETSLNNFSVFLWGKKIEQKHPVKTVILYRAGTYELARFLIQKLSLWLNRLFKSEMFL